MFSTTTTSSTPLVFLLLSLLFVGACHAFPIQTNGASLRNDLHVLSSSLPQASEGGGIKCAACTIVLSIVETYSVAQNKSIDRVFDDLCGYLPESMTPTCIDLVNTYGATIIHLIEEEGLGPDAVCSKVNVCTNSTCILFDNTTEPFAASASSSSSSASCEGAMRVRSHFVRKVLARLDTIPKSRTTPSPSAASAFSARTFLTSLFGDIDPWQWIKDEVNKLANQHEPIDDVDGDFFSDMETLRGSSWRGKDCDDMNAAVHPGALSPMSSSNDTVDYDCNGISGTNDTTQKGYESELCDSVLETSPRLGTIILGDSAAAHFHIPPAWMEGAAIDSETYTDLLFAVANEIDWPQFSWATGHFNTTWDIPGPMSSIYDYLYQYNRCNHRDFQNIGVNGARVGQMYESIINSTARLEGRDHPALVFFALIGNDVCNGHHTYSTMTTPAEFRADVLESMVHLNNTLPWGSHVVFVGLPDGTVLYDTMHNRTHPLGCTYRDVYDYLNCLGISPCWGYMNSNEAVRNFTGNRAAELNLEYQYIIGNSTFLNETTTSSSPSTTPSSSSSGSEYAWRFDMDYYEAPFAAAMKIWESNGGDPAVLIEPVDGFHPAQTANAMMAQILWKDLQADHPSWLGAPNPNNDLIKEMFGDQGGY
eukprot:TRINITY_DN1600_c0_g1_i1.p1 TRINITY_DN1600_c0_g1~~TRINITY_DN1600_c0_g1_i1.p1  ORF type:complete len:649 (-),score=183.38 TRINITY_DN1600_c0_g1_i1:194-2140(-)